LAKRVLITGGAGFIGSHVSERFLEAGWSVEILDDLSTGKRSNVPAQARLHTLDVRTPEAARLVADGFDVVVHLAAQMDVRRSVADPVFDASVNIIGMLNVAEAIRSAGRADSTRLVFSSTGGVLYGDFTTPPNRENFPKDPESPYAISKLSSEFYLAYYGRVHRLQCVALRCGNVYGPRQDPHGEAGVVAIFCGRILDAKALTIFGDGEQTRDYVYVKDVAQAIFIAATQPLPPVERLDARGFNIGTGVGTSVNEIARLLIHAAGSRVGMEYAPARPGEQQRSVLAVEKAREVLGWRATMSLEDGLAATMAWFAQARTAAGRA
jgi:UDP-glucose 4-epimerase